MANNPQNPSSNLADILRTLSALAPQNQKQARSQTPESLHGLPLRGPTDYQNPGHSNSQDESRLQPQPWQPSIQPWQPPSQGSWQPPQQQTPWQPPQQVINQQSYPLTTATPPPQQPQHYLPPPQSSHPSQQKQQQPSMQHHQRQTPPQPMPHPRQVQMQQMSDPHHLQRIKEKEMQRQRGLDPATIIDWPTGLRCVMKTVAMNEKVISEIKKLIQVQNAHETQWYAGRKALIMKAADRAAERRIGQKKLDDMLKAVGGMPSSENPSTLPTPEQEAEALKTELEVFDAKVYRAQFEMVKEMTAKLRSLGVPFFGTKSDLVVLRGRPGSKEGTPSEGGGKSEEKKEVEKGKISEMELVDLQRKMLAILQDLCDEK